MMRVSKRVARPLDFARVRRRGAQRLQLRVDGALDLVERVPGRAVTGDLKLRAEDQRLLDGR
jgi:hypothetical protein